MRTTLRVMLAAAALTVAAGTTAWVSQPVSGGQRTKTDARASEARVISALDDCLQDRFKDVDEKFGMARIARGKAHRFQPENIREVEALRGLERAKLRVVFYLAGRRVLGAMPGPGSWREEDGWGIIKGPVDITPVSARRSSLFEDNAPPRPRDLWEDSRRAMMAFASAESHEFTNAGWKFIARPVRASSESCLECHGAPKSFVRPSLGIAADRSLKIGDSIGAAIYGYRAAR
jgi:hypothetical protein